MKFIELTVHTTSEASELVADVMWQYTEGGVAVSDAKDVVALIKGDTGVYWDYIDDELKLAEDSTNADAAAILGL